MNKIDLAEKNLERISNWISHADQKVGITLVFQVGLVGFLATSRIDEVKAILTQPCSVSSALLLISLGLFLFFIIKGAHHSLRALYPDTTKRKGQNSFFFFGTIFSMGLDNFKKKFSKLKENEIEEDLNNQTFINSEIATAKFINIKAAINNTGIAAIFWILSLILIAFLKPTDVHNMHHIFLRMR